MQAWAAVAIAQLVLVAFSLWRLGRLEDRTIRWPGVALFVVAALALLVLVRHGGYWSAIAVFGSIVLATDALLLGGALVTSLCTQPAPPAPEADEPRDLIAVEDETKEAS